MNEQTKVYTSPEEKVAWLGTDPIPAKAYYDPEWFELERQAIFMRTWIEVGHVCELPEPGTWIRRELEFANASILIVRGKDGQIRAFYNACTHRGTQLVEEESGKGANFLCPYHFWNFGDDGRLIAAPDFERFALEKKDCKIPKVSVDTHAGLIFINLDPNPRQTLLEHLGAYAEGMEKLPVARATHFAEYSYEIDANWKITYDNFQENYHLRHVHGLTGIATVHPDNLYGYPTDYTFDGNNRTQEIWSNPTPKITPMQGYNFGLAAKFGMEEGVIGGPHDRTYFAIFPSFFIIGTPIQHFSHKVYPISATKSRGVFRVYWVGADDSASKRYAREYSLASIHDIHIEDVNIIRRAQKGLLSGAIKNIHFMTMEGLCRHLYQCVAKEIEAWQAEQAAKGEPA
ncbi:aromatic ring-hydroxylating dioxygenase subunit alpha [Novosphingobium sp. TH158]|uniref:aromatic ring-hydroxylating oxygenase subunit alpha n=1 Tax=Novosphingobium sp. TH158 TaxID=2067455 RepID=UPI000C7AC2C2|nr:aromatic ring-hydroxylating dioxygenase subunit alpha [Novosphingobium sp. TH158]PLK25823.1 (2Fe-2S)-binding protein [Novosphingobium sp. TH158]